VVVEVVNVVEAVAFVEDEVVVVFDEVEDLVEDEVVDELGQTLTTNTSAFCVVLSLDASKADETASQ
jgi:hypothetical protein